MNTIILKPIKTIKTRFIKLLGTLGIFTLLLAGCEPSEYKFPAPTSQKEFLLQYVLTKAFITNERKLPYSDQKNNIEVYKNDVWDSIVDYKTRIYSPTNLHEYIIQYLQYDYSDPKKDSTVFFVNFSAGSLGLFNKKLYYITGDTNKDNIPSLDKEYVMLFDINDDLNYYDKLVSEYEAKNK
jgi:hypothetical protein